MGGVGEFLVDRVRVAREKVLGGLSRIQQQKINQRAFEVIPKLVDSDLVRAIRADREATIVPLVEGKVGRNENCPCGSLKKYKNATAREVVVHRAQAGSKILSAAPCRYVSR
ncbi:SEC-C metal-binding domain-containing protein [Cystobacter ferrugineus]|uniref:SEC-C metal-binding domain-containing protein n=1 Tax=Cystobacter ferrugineus TaxID=83449 RepID=UPI003CCBE71B